MGGGGNVRHERILRTHAPAVRDQAENGSHGRTLFLGRGRWGDAKGSTVG
jgi:hypothetical protein